MQLLYLVDNGPCILFQALSNEASCNYYRIIKMYAAKSFYYAIIYRPIVVLQEKSNSYQPAKGEKVIEFMFEVFL